VSGLEATKNLHKNQACMVRTTVKCSKCARIYSIWLFTTRGRNQRMKQMMYTQGIINGG
jgi:hypothetical protein